MPNTEQNSEPDTDFLQYPKSLLFLEDHPEILRALDKNCHAAAVHLEHELSLWQEHGRPCLEEWRTIKLQLEPGCPSLF
jgi:hypothetical protein